MTTRKPRPKKLTQEEFEAARKRDAYALAQLILDIWLEKKHKEAQNGTTNG